MTLPLYGFLKGDTLGLVILVNEENTVQELAEKLILAANVRVQIPENCPIEVILKERKIPLETLIKNTNFKLLDRFDVRW